MYQNSQLLMMHNVLNTDPIFSVPNATDVSNINTLPKVPRMTDNNRSVPKKPRSVQTDVVYQLVYQSAPNVPKLTRNDVSCTKH